MSLGLRLIGVVMTAVCVALCFGRDVGVTWVTVGLSVTGLFLTLGRSGVTLDFDHKRCVTYWGLLTRWSNESRPFSSLDRVSVNGVERRGRQTGHRFEFPIELKGQGPDVYLEAHKDYRKARLKARDLARALGLSFEDHGQLRDVDHLDEPLRDRLLRTNEVPGALVLGTADPFRTATTYRQAPAAPADCKVAATDGIDETTLAIPGRFRATAIGILSTIGFALLAPIEALVWPTQRHPSFGPAIFVGLLLLAPLYLGVLPWLRAVTSKWRVTIGHGALTVDRISLFGTHRTSFPVEELDDVHVSSADEPRYHNLTRRNEYPAALPFVVARSDRRAVAFGVGLSTAELEWMAARIQHAIATRSMKR